MIDVTLIIDNHYPDDKITVTVETQVPAPPALDTDEYEDWEQDHIFPLTGTGRDGDSCYFVTVASSSDPAMLPVGTEFEFGL